MKNISVLFSLLLCCFLFSCSSLEGNQGTNGSSTEIASEWSIPNTEVFDGGPGKDGIPSIDSPKFSLPSAIDFLTDDDLVIATQVGDEVRAYPHSILDWHEIVNDRIGNTSLAITYCPLTGTAIAWDRIIDGTETTFGVSGLLYNTNLIPYDRATNSNWSQLKHECVNGDRIGTQIKTQHAVEMSFKTFKEMYPTGLVMNTETTFDRDYDNYPYGTYRTDDQLIFPIDNTDNRLQIKERVLGLIENGVSKAFRFEKFLASGISIHQDSFNTESIIVVGSSKLNFMTAYKTTLLGGTTLAFTPLQNQFPLVMEDNEGNKWDVFGVAQEGPRSGTSLIAPLNYIGYWFAWATFNPDIILVE